MSRLFICSVVPNEFIVKLKASQAANNFCNRLIDGNCFDKIYSVLPISYNFLPCKDDKITYSINNGMNALSKLFKFVINTMNVVKKAKAHDYIWLYNIISSLINQLFFFTSKYCIIYLGDYLWKM